MELITLDSNFQPLKPIDSYESLVWAERYLESGDFILTSGDISGMVSAMPLESYVSLRESTTPMVVENYKIVKPLNEGPKIQVTGRSFETVLERRASVLTLPGDYTITPRIPWMMNADKQSDAAYKAIRAVIGDGARSQGGGEVLAAIAPAVSPLDAIPEINLVLPADYSTGTTTPIEIKSGNLYSTVIELLAANHHGIKSVRPNTLSDTTVDVEIYNGADLTTTVLFDARFDVFNDSTYLLSSRGSANLAYIYGSNGAQAVRKNNAGAEVSGLNRRILVLEESGDATLTNSEVRVSRALVELYKYNATALFDGETSLQVASGFNQTYFLGDLLKLVGEYGLSQNVRVAEFIRSADSSGEKAYPTFEAID